MKILQIGLILSIIVGMVGDVYYGPPMYDTIDHLDSIENSIDVNESEFKNGDKTERQMTEGRNGDGGSYYENALGENEGEAPFELNEMHGYDIGNEYHETSIMEEDYTVEELNQNAQEHTYKRNVVGDLKIQTTNSSEYDDAPTQIQRKRRKSNRAQLRTVDSTSLLLGTKQVKRKRMKRTKELRSRLETQVRQLFRKHHMVKHKYLTFLPRGFVDRPFKFLLYAPNAFVALMHSVPRYNFKFEEVAREVSFGDANYEQSLAIIVIVYSGTGIFVCLTIVVISFKFRKARLLRKQYNRYRRILSLMASLVLMLSTSVVGQIGYLKYLTAVDIFFGIQNIIRKNEHEFNIFREDITMYKVMFKDLDKYFDPVKEAFPKLHKMNIDTSNLERKMEVLKRFVNQTDFQERLDISQGYYEFMKGLLQSNQISMLSKGVVATLPGIWFTLRAAAMYFVFYMVSNTIVTDTLKRKHLRRLSYAFMELAMILCWILSGLIVSFAIVISDYCYDPPRTLILLRKQIGAMPEKYRGQDTLEVLLHGRMEAKLFGVLINKTLTLEYSANEVMAGRQIKITMDYVDKWILSLFETGFEILPDEYATTLREFEAEYLTHRNMTYYSANIREPHWFLSPLATSCHMGIESLKTNIYMTAMLAMTLTLLLVIVARYRQCTKVVKVCRPIDEEMKPLYTKKEEKEVQSRQERRSKSELSIIDQERPSDRLFERPGAHFFPRPRRSHYFGRTKAYSIEGDGSSLSCRKEVLWRMNCDLSTNVGLRRRHDD